MPTCLVTGSSRGIGLEFAKQYAAEGWEVIATCRRRVQSGALHPMDAKKALAAELVARFLPPYEPALRLDPARPRSFGGTSTPAQWRANRLAMQAAMGQALEAVNEAGTLWGELTGRPYAAVERYRLDDAELALVTAGGLAARSVNILCQVCLPPWWARPEACLAHSYEGTGPLKIPPKEARPLRNSQVRQNPRLTAPRARLACRLGGFVTNPHE